MIVGNDQGRLGLDSDPMNPHSSGYLSRFHGIFVRDPQSSDSERDRKDKHFIDGEPVPRDDMSIDFTCVCYNGDQVPLSKGNSTTELSKE